MFEGWASDVLVSWLGQVLDIQQEQLKVNLWTAWKTGITLNDVALRRTLLHHVENIPCQLVHGRIGTLQVQVPWKALVSPLVLSLSHVDVTIGLLRDEGFENSDEMKELLRERYRAHRQAQLAGYQLKAVAGSVKEDDRPGILVSFLRHALSLLLKRLCIHISDVTIRLVDHEGRPLCSLHIGEMRTMDNEKNELVGKEEGEGDTAQGSDQMDDADDYIVPPVEGCMMGKEEASIVEQHVRVLAESGSRKSLKIRDVSVNWEKGGPTKIFETHVDVELMYNVKMSPSRIFAGICCRLMTCHLVHEHVKEIQNLLEEIEWQSLRFKYAHLRPHRFKPDEMWRFALNAVLFHMHGPFRFSPFRTEDVVHSRRKYILLYRKRLERDSQYNSMYSHERNVGSGPFDKKGHILSAVGEAQMEKLEDSLSISDVLACQATAKKSLETYISRKRRNTTRQKDVRRVDNFLVEAPDGNLGKSVWMTIPTLADLEGMFESFNFDPRQDVVNSNFDLITVTTMTIDTIELFLNRKDGTSEFHMVLSNARAAIVRSENEVSLDSFALGRFGMFGPEGRVIIQSPDMEERSSHTDIITLFISRKENLLHVDVGALEIVGSLRDFITLQQYVPATTRNAYQCKTMETAFQINSRAYGVFCAEKLFKMGKCLDIVVEFHKARLILEGFTLTVDKIHVSSTQEGDRFKDLQHVLSVMDAFQRKIENNSVLMEQSITSLETILSYRRFEAHILGLGCSFFKDTLIDGTNMNMELYSNRLLGDVSKPMMDVQIQVDSLDMRLSPRIVEKFADISSAASSLQVNGTDDSLEEHWKTTLHFPVANISLLDDEVGYIIKCSLHDGDVSATSRSEMISGNSSFSAIKMHMPPTESTFMGMNIPKIFEDLALIDISFGLELNQETLKTLKLEIHNLELTGCRQEPGCYIRRIKGNNGPMISIVSSEENDISAVHCVVQNTDIGHTLLLKAYVLADLYSSPSQGSVSPVPAVRFEMLEVRVGLMYDKNTTRRTSDAYFHDYGLAHGSLASLTFEHIIFIRSDDATSPTELMHLSVSDFKVNCGIYGYRGMTMLPILHANTIQLGQQTTAFKVTAGNFDLGFHPNQAMMISSIVDMLKSQYEIYDDLWEGTDGRKSNSVMENSDSSQFGQDWSSLVVQIDRISLSLLGRMDSSSSIFVEFYNLAFDTLQNLQVSTLSLGEMAISLISRQEHSTSQLDCMEESLNNDTSSSLSDFHTPTKSLYQTKSKQTSNAGSEISRYYSLESVVDPVEVHRDSISHTVIPLDNSLDSSTESLLLFSLNSINQECLKMNMEFQGHRAVLNILPISILLECSISDNLVEWLETYMSLQGDLIPISESSTKDPTQSKLDFRVNFDSVILCLAEGDEKLLEGTTRCEIFVQVKGKCRMEQKKGGTRTIYDIESAYLGYNCEFDWNERKLKGIPIDTAIFGLKNLIFSHSTLYDSKAVNNGHLQKIDVSIEDISIWLEYMKVVGIRKNLESLSNAYSKLAGLQWNHTDEVKGQKPAGIPLTCSTSINLVTVQLGGRSRSFHLKPIVEICVSDTNILVSACSTAAMSGSLTFVLSTASYNLRTGARELLLEEATFKANLTIPEQSTEGRHFFPGELTLASSACNFIITKSIFRNVILAKLLLDQVQNGPDVTTDPAAKLLTTCEVKNTSGCTVYLWISDDYDQMSEPPDFALNDGQSCFPLDSIEPLAIFKGGYPCPVKGVKRESKHAFSKSPRVDKIIFKLESEGSSIIGKFQLNKIGLSCCHERLDQPKVIVETKELFPGSLQCIFHSVVKVVNASAFPVEIECIYSNVGPREETNSLLHLETNRSYWLPVSNNLVRYRFRAFPDNLDDPSCATEWTAPIDLTLEGEIESSVQLCLTYYEKGESKKRFVRVQTRTFLSGMCEIILSCPVVLRSTLPMPVTASLSGKRWCQETLLNSSFAVLAHHLDIEKVEKLQIHAEGYQPSLDALLLWDGPKLSLKKVENSKYKEHVIFPKLENDNSLLFELHGEDLGTADILACVEHSVDEVTGSHEFFLSTPVWIYNRTNLPLSLSCSLEPRIASSIESLSSETSEDSNDVVPDVWVPPYFEGSLKTDSSPCASEAALTSVPSFQSSLQDLDTRVSQDETNGHSQSNMANGISPGLGSLVQQNARLPISCSLLGSKPDLDLQASPGSIVTPKNPMISYPSAVNVFAANALVNNSQAFHVRFSKCQAPQGLTYWSEAIRWIGHETATCTLSVPILYNIAGTKQEVSSRPHLGEYPIVAKRNAMGNKPLEITFSPKFVVKNDLNSPLQFKQQGTSLEYNIMPYSSCPLKWTDAQGPQRICIRVHEAGWLWSGGFTLTDLGDIFIKIRHRDRGVTKTIIADIEADSDGVYTITMSLNNKNFVPYRLDNCSLETLHVRQKGVLDQFDILRPYCSLDYAWDEPFTSNKIILESTGGKIGSFDLNKIGLDRVVTAGKAYEKSSTLRITVRSEGPTKVLTIQDTTIHSEQEVSLLRSTTNRITDERFVFLLRIDSLSASLLQEDEEKFFIYLKKGTVDIAVDPSRASISFKFAKLQIDNPSPYAIYPAVAVLPAPESSLTSAPSNNAGLTERTDAFMCKATCWRIKPAGVICFQECAIRVKSLAVYLEQSILNTASMLAEEYRLESVCAQSNHAHSLHRYGVDPPRGENSTESKQKKIKYYFDRLSVSPIEVSLSFLSSLDASPQGTTALQKFINLADVEDARLWLSGMKLDNITLESHSLVDMLLGHYRRAVILDFFKLVGAASVLGDPMSALHHVRLGVWEFISGPAIGLVESAKTFGPNALLLGFVSGTLGLFQNILFAASNATTKASGAAHKAILLWGFDTQSKHKKTGRNRRIIDAQVSKKDMAGTGLIGAIFEGAVGLVTDPIRGAEENGIRGFLSGIRHGVLGIFLIPMAAFLEMSSETASSIQRSIAGSSNIGWIRPPRMQNSKNEQPYNYQDSMGRWLFLQLQHSGKDNMSTDSYVSCVQVQAAGTEERFIVFTSSHILIIEAVGLSWAPHILWETTLDLLETVLIRSTNLRFVANPPSDIHASWKLKNGLYYLQKSKMFDVYEASCIRTDSNVTSTLKELEIPWTTVCN